MISWIIFFYCLHIFSQKKGITKPVFSDIMSFTIAIFFFARLFYMFSAWRDTKFGFQSFLSGNASLMEFLQNFFITDNYNLSLAGGIIGFAIVFFWKTRDQKNMHERYLDAIVPSFLIASIVGYFGAFLGGQIYGVSSSLFFAVDYNTKYSSIPGKLFPLAILYILITIGLLVVWRTFENKNIPDGYVGNILLGGIGVMLFFGEFLSGKPDMFEIFIRLNQLVGICFIIVAIV